MEQRHLIQNGLSSLTVALPRKWLDARQLKKGDPIFIREEGNTLLVTSEKSVKGNKVSINITSLDYTSLVHYIQGLYRFGYDEIELHFDTPKTTRYRTNEEFSIGAVIHHKANQFIGMEVLEQSKNRILLKTIIKETEEDFNTILRRIFLVLNDASETLLNGVRENDLLLLESVLQKHDMVNKFVNYALRLLNKQGYPDTRKTCFYYHIIAQLDKVADFMKQAAKDILLHKKEFHKETISLFDDAHSCLLLYYQLFYKFDLKTVDVFSKKRYGIREKTRALKNVSYQELHSIVLYTQLLEILMDLVDARMGLEY